MSRLRFAAPDAGPGTFCAPDTRHCCLFVNPWRRWTARASYFRYAPVEPRHTVQFFIVWMPVDKWITCGLSMGLDNRVENSSRQQGTSRDEAGEVAARRRARVEGLQRLVRRVDAARGDDLDACAESRAQAAHVLERLCEERRAGEAARLLRQARLVDAASVAAVDDGDARLERRGDRRLLVGVTKIRRDLDDDRLVRGLANRPKHARELLRSLGPSVDELGVGRRDVDLREIAEGRQPLA